METFHFTKNRSIGWGRLYIVAFSILCYLATLVRAEWLLVRPPAVAYSYVGVVWTSKSTVLAAGNAATGGAISQSTDAGLTWTTVWTGSTAVIRGLAIRKLGSITYYIASCDSGRVLLSTTGTTWTRYSPATTSFPGVTIGPNGMAFLSSLSSVWVSTNTSSFQTWSKKAISTPITNSMLFDVRYVQFSSFGLFWVFVWPVWCCCFSLAHLTVSTLLLLANMVIFTIRATAVQVGQEVLVAQQALFIVLPMLVFLLPWLEVQLPTFLDLPTVEQLGPTWLCSRPARFQFNFIPSPCCQRVLFISLVIMVIFFAR